MLLSRAPLNLRERARRGAGAAWQPTATLTHTRRACPHACVHTRRLPVGTQASTPVYLVVLLCRPYSGCAHTRACTLSSHLRRDTHVHVHTSPIHTCLSTHTRAIALTVGTDAHFFYLDTHTCADVCDLHLLCLRPPPNWSTYLHAHTYACCNTHTNPPCSHPHTRACDPPASRHTPCDSHAARCLSVSV